MYYNGQVVGTVRKPSDLLLIFLLKSKRPEVYRERYDLRSQTNLNVASVVKVIHEYHDSPPAIDVVAAQQPHSTARLMATTASSLPGNDTDDNADMFTISSPPCNENPED